MAFAGSMLVALVAAPQLPVAVAAEDAGGSWAAMPVPLLESSAIAPARPDEDLLPPPAGLLAEPAEDLPDDTRGLAAPAPDTHVWAYRHRGGALDLQPLTGPLVGQGLAHRHGVEGRMRQESSLRFGLARLDDSGSGVLVDLRSGPLGFPEDRVESHLQLQHGIRLGAHGRFAARVFHQRARDPEDAVADERVAAAASAAPGDPATGDDPHALEDEDLLGVGGRWTRGDAFLDLSTARLVGEDGWRSEVSAGWSWLAGEELLPDTAPAWRLSLQLAWRQDGQGATRPGESVTALFLVTLDS